VILPVFPGQIPNVEMFLQTPAIRLDKSAVLTGIKLTVDTTPLVIGVSAGILVNFTKNPQLEFDLGGKLSADGSLQLSGDMLGTWKNVFGIHGFDLSDVAAALAFNPALCAVDLCISGFGIGFNLMFGTKQITFYGYIEVPQLEKIFVEAGISGANPNSLALSFRDVAIQWNKMIGQRTININVNDIPADWGLKDMAFHLAPEAGTFANKYYDAGFWFMGGFRLIGIDCDVNVQISDSDFHFGVHMSVQTFETELKKHLHLAVMQNPQDFPSWTPEMRNQLATMRSDIQGQFELVSVKNVTITQFSMEHFARQNNPIFTMEYEFLGHHKFQTPVPIFHWYKDFENFFHVFLKALFK